MVFYQLDLSKLTIEQMKAINLIINHSCGDIEFEPSCDLCESMEDECWQRSGKTNKGVDICRCG